MNTNCISYENNQEFKHYSSDRYLHFTLFFHLEEQKQKVEGGKLLYNEKVRKIMKKFKNNQKKIELEEFDSVAEIYDDDLKQLLGVLGGDTEKFAEYKVQLCKHLVKNNISSILDFGCGTGRSLVYFKKYFDSVPNLKLYGCDTSPKSIEVAKKILPDGKFFLNSDVDSFRKTSDKYDLIFLACVYHHIEPDTRTAWTKAMIEKLNAGGYIVVFEHNLLNPYTRKIVRNPKNILDHEEYMLSHKELINLLVGHNPNMHTFWEGFVLFSPVRFRWSSTFETCLRKLPIGAQHCVIAQKKN